MHEDYLEDTNMMLATGMIDGLYAKDELPDFQDTHDELVDSLKSRIRRNLHIVVLNSSPANTKFME